MKKISNGVYAFELEMERLGQTSTIYPLLIFDGDTSAMIDAGLPTSIPEIEAQLGDIGLAISDIDALIWSMADYLAPKHGLSADEEEAYASIAKLTKYDIEDVLCYHGGLFAGDARKRIAELANVALGGEER